MGFLISAAIFGALLSNSASQEIEVPAATQGSSDGQVTRLDEVVVTALATDVSNRIDRRVYSVRDDPDSQILPLVDILGKLPSVTVSPGGRVALLGSPNITILVDGKAVADPQAFLRSVPGSRVDSVEVMTNPPAEFSAQGTGGIINIITRRSFLPGLTGSGSAYGNSFGSHGASLSPRWSSGPWSVSGTLRLGNERPESEVRRQRAFIGAEDALEGSSEEIGEVRSRDDNVSLDAKVGYKPTERDTLNFSVELGRSKGWTESSSTLDYSDQENYSQQSVRDSRFDAGKIGLGYER